MKIKLKKVADQVIVLTGATSGIGLVTARMAAKKGARLVLAARSENALRQLSDEINQAGGHAVPVVADISQEADVRRLAQAAIQEFGGFDTWVNNAGVSIYGKMTQMPVEDMRRQFDTNVWGVVYGSLEAVAHFRQRGSGSLINIGSILSETTAILQTSYSATKHAVKGFTDGLRMELELDKVPVAVSLVKPAAINTPYTIHAKNYLDREPQHNPPAYAPELVAQAILHCAETGMPEITVGGGGKMITVLNHYAPRLTDLFMEKAFAPGSKSEQPAHAREQNGLERGVGQLQERGNYPGHTRETSLYTAATMHPALAAAAAVGTGLALAAWLNRSGKGKDQNGHGHPGSSVYRSQPAAYTAD